MADNEDLLRRVDALQERLSLMEDRDAIQRLQNMYGFYIDNRMWTEMAGLFAEKLSDMMKPHSPETV